ncbi:hypothetical protein CC1G_14722 [Coprinopsis cinerea okayama7|uniref:Uncharacterized protein n=1 Tax=Coprinopsis cinerea (strain Okayama-7 / 130 / ATCC MYA-4618 / FGSC 9003) TaxID=240176 RepID=D6RN11_COPC7|nr:hypothetical protein CC1G_14722 [Coprinopsis cinerea okayama7\|eukprot:XP_002911293.1 hypothetical protein CC1G_14722 [Coprinopsis cinerea okayama7\
MSLQSILNPTTLTEPLPLSATASQRRAQHKLIGSRISALEEEIRQWKSRQNELAEISRLPPEILSRIFVCYKELISSQGGRSESLYWTKVYHVSQHWRAVALNYPQLWSTIDTSHGHWANAMFERSKQVPISFIYSRHHPFKSFEDLALNVFSQAQRPESLEILDGPRFLNERVQQLIAPAPLLRRLKFERG